jgi:hypothetical protein
MSMFSGPPDRVPGGRSGESRDVEDDRAVALMLDGERLFAALVVPRQRAVSEAPPTLLDHSVDHATWREDAQWRYFDAEHDDHV